MLEKLMKFMEENNFYIFKFDGHLISFEEGDNIVESIDFDRTSDEYKFLDQLEDEMYDANLIPFKLKLEL